MNDQWKKLWRIIPETDGTLCFAADLDIANILDRTGFHPGYVKLLTSFQDFGVQILKAFRSREVG